MAMVRWMIYVLTCCLFAGSAFGQKKKVERFKTLDGKSYSRGQRDSIERAGNFVGVKEKWESRDTSYYSIFFYDRKFLLTPLQKRLQDKPLLRLRATDMNGDSVDTRALLGTPVFMYLTDGEVSVPEAIQLNDLKDRFADRVSFIAVMLQSADSLRMTIKETNLQFTVLPSCNAYCSELKLNLGPNIFLVDRIGNIKAVAEGVPVDLRYKADGTVRLSGEEPRLILYEYWVPLIEKILE